MSEKKIEINDNYLLYQIKNNNDDEALYVMMEKYDNLIKSRIKKYAFPKEHYEDYLQEGRITLTKAIETYDEKFNKTFTKYFELLLTNRFNTLYKKNKKEKQHFSLIDISEIEIVDSKTKQYGDLEINNLTNLEKEVFNMRFKQNLSIKDISENLNMDSKKIYNTIQRIRNKAKK